jgi:hypothetical protein
MNDTDDDVGMAVLVEVEYTPVMIIVVVLSVMMMAMIISSRRWNTLFIVLLLLLLGRDNAIILRRNVLDFVERGC